jgi:hypothetical protein
MLPEELEQGYWRAYRDFYRWGSILQGASTKEDWTGRLRHVAYAGGWKKAEPMWNLAIRARRVVGMLPMLEAVLAGFGSRQRVTEDTVTAETTATAPSLLRQPAPVGEGLP